MEDPGSSELSEEIISQNKEMINMELEGLKMTLNENELQELDLSNNL